MHGGIVPSDNNDSQSLVPLDYNNLPTDWDSQKVDRYVAHVNQMRKNASKLVASKIPISCKGDACSFHRRCDLFIAGLAPIGKPCPVEGTVLSHTFAGLCESLDVDPSDWVDVNLVRELSQIEVELLRVAQMLAEEGLIQNKCVGLVDGEPVFQEDEHVLLRTEDRLRKQKAKIMQLLNSTRKDKAANKIDITLNSPESFLDRIMSNAKNANRNILDLNS